MTDVCSSDLFRMKIHLKHPLLLPDGPEPCLIKRGMFFEYVAVGDDDRGDEGAGVSGVFSYGSAGGGRGGQFGNGGECGGAGGGVGWLEREKEKQKAEVARKRGGVGRGGVHAGCGGGGVLVWVVSPS